MPTATKQNGPRLKDQDRGQTPAYLTTQEASALSGMTVAWLERGRWRGDGPPYVKLGAAVRYPVDDLHAFMRARMRTSTTEGAAVDLINENPPISSTAETRAAMNAVSRRRQPTPVRRQRKAPPIERKAELRESREGADQAAAQ
jgi:hypothetical protein